MKPVARAVSRITSRSARYTTEPHPVGAALAAIKPIGGKPPPTGLLPPVGAASAAIPSSSGA